MKLSEQNWIYAPMKWAFDALARLPLSALYVLSDALYFVTFHVVRYRRKVALDNIRRSFPKKTEAEHNAILKQFFRNFTDYFVETIKLNHISDDEIKRRMQFEGLEIVDRLFDEGKSIVTYFSHCGNWEWAPSVTLWSRHKSPEVEFCQVYRPLRNKWFDAYFLHLRSRFNPLSFPKRTVLRDLLKLRRDGVASITGFMSDQKPSHGDPTEPLMFLSQPTAMITGTETLARKLNMAVIYWDMQKISRGHYKIVTRLMTENAADMPHMALTDSYARLLEATIRRNPSIWLWTHKRWKYPVTIPLKDTSNETDSSNNTQLER